MQLAIIGLGKMGANMARRLLRAGHDVVGMDLDNLVTDQLAANEGLVPAYSIADALLKARSPRIVWMMLPAGEPTETAFRALVQRMSSGDILIDGGNSNYKDSLQRSETAAEHGLSFVDAGVSGGVWGLEEGYSLMVGGEVETVERLRPILESLAPAPDRGWGHVGPAGAGHFTKMIHNGVEYGLMQAYAEGFDLLRAKKEFELDLHQVAEIWRHGSVVRSWLLDLTANALKQDQALSSIRGWVDDSGEGRWTVHEAVDLDVPAPVITLALQMRFVSRQDDSYAARVLAAMRQQFGGHPVRKKSRRK